MTLAALADAHYVDQAQRARVAVNTAQRTWQNIPVESLWERWHSGEAARLAELVNGAQAGAARASDAYLAQTTALQGVDMPGRLNAAAFTSPHDELLYWLGTAPARVTYDLRRGVPGVIARRRGLKVLNRMVGTLVQDAGREGVGAGMMITPGLDGYYRKLRTPSCDRCMILAGEYYRMEEAFKRHPVCDCVHVPVADHDAYDPEMDPIEAIRSGKVGSWRELPDGTKRFESSLSEAEIEAILNGDADPYRIVNAKRQGMRATPMWGKRENTPHKLFRRAGGDKDAYRRLMIRHGFILT